MAHMADPRHFSAQGSAAHGHDAQNGNIMNFQHADRIVYCERSYDLMDQPLEAYFDLIDSRPPFLRPNPNSRGYFADWAIVDGWLYLTSINALWEDATPVNLKQLFPLTGERVFAAWLTGPLRCYHVESSPIALNNVVRAPDLSMRINCGRMDTATGAHRPLARPLERAPAQAKSAEIIPFQSRAARIVA
jgi:hypothetical protein